MYKYIVLLFLFFPLISFPQAKLSFQKTDSLSYQYFLKSDWKKLIGLTKEAFKQDIDSKFMRQRAGYAYFMTGDYAAAKKQYEKALAFDLGDDISRDYLYYSCFNLGSENTRFYAGNLSIESKTRLGIRQYNPVEFIDTEYNLKTDESSTRSNQMYYRVGINTELGYRVSLYQAFSYYEQTISWVLTKQPEYLALLKWTISPVWHLKIAYHRLSTNSGNIAYPGNMGYISLSSQLNRVNLEANASVLKSSLGTTNQMGLQASYILPGRSNIYITSSLVGMIESSAFRTIYSQTAGLKCFKNLWAEGNMTLGNLKNYNTNNSIYIYNSVDPTIFRTGLSLFYFVGKHLTLIGNFTFDQQEIENIIFKAFYYQYSYSGGLKWRL